MCDFDLIIIGGGVAGHLGAIKASKSGLKVACIESTSLGGAYINSGAIPTNLMVNVAHKYLEAKESFSNNGVIVKGDVSIDMQILKNRTKGIVGYINKGYQALIKKNNITFFNGFAEFSKEKNQVVIHNQDGTVVKLNSKDIIIATGSKPLDHRFIPFDNKNIISAEELLKSFEIPKKLIIIGGGASGSELAYAYAILGSDVTLLESRDRILNKFDHDSVSIVETLFKHYKIKIFHKTIVKNINNEKNQITTNFGILDYDKLIVAIGRKGNTDKLHLENQGIDCNKLGIIKVNSDFKTSVNHIYAVGDVIGGIMTANKAEAEVLSCIDIILGKASSVNYQTIGQVVNTVVKIARIGTSEKFLLEGDYDYKPTHFPFMAIPRAMINESVNGFVKVLSDEKSDRILGVNVVGIDADHIINSAAIAMEYNASAEDLAIANQLKPTSGEALKNASIGSVYGHLYL